MFSHQKLFASVLSLVFIFSIFYAANPSAQQIAQQRALEQARQQAAAQQAQQQRDANWARIQNQWAAQQRPK